MRDPAGGPHGRHGPPPISTLRNVSSRIARLGSRLLSRVLDVPPPTTDYTVSRVTTPMRDGVELVGSHYAPTGTAKGTLLVRCPYGRGFPFGPAFGAAYARRGYHVLLQSVLLKCAPRIYRSCRKHAHAVRNGWPLSAC